MPRRREVPKREILPDPKYGNVELSKFMNVIMEGGKKAVAERIIYGALENMEKKTGKDPVELFHVFKGTINDALSNRFFAAFHDHIHELGELDIAELGIRQDFTFRDFTTTWHISPLCFSLMAGRPIQTPRKFILNLHLLDSNRESLR